MATIGTVLQVESGQVRNTYSLDLSEVAQAQNAKVST